MKTDALSLQHLLSHFMSLRAAAHVTAALFRQHGLELHKGVAAKAAQHAGNAKSAAALAFLAQLSLAELEAYIAAKLQPKVDAIKAEVAAAAAQLQASRPAVHAKAVTPAEVDAWWENEGRYEEWVEDRGETKAFHHLNSRRKRGGQHLLTPRTYFCTYLRD